MTTLIQNPGQAGTGGVDLSPQSDYALRLSDQLAKFAGDVGGLALPQGIKKDMQEGRMLSAAGATIEEAKAKDPYLFQVFGGGATQRSYVAETAKRNVLATEADLTAELEQDTFRAMTPEQYQAHTFRRVQETAKAMGGGVETAAYLEAAMDMSERLAPVQAQKHIEFVQTETYNQAAGTIADSAERLEGAKYNAAKQGLAYASSAEYQKELSNLQGLLRTPNSNMSSEARSRLLYDTARSDILEGDGKLAEWITSELKGDLSGPHRMELEQMESGMRVERIQQDPGFITASINIQEAASNGASDVALQSMLGAMENQFPGAVPKGFAASVRAAGIGGRQRAQDRALALQQMRQGKSVATDVGNDVLNQQLKEAASSPQQVGFILGNSPVIHKGSKDTLGVTTMDVKFGQGEGSITGTQANSLEQLGHINAANPNIAKDYATTPAQKLYLARLQGGATHAEALQSIMSSVPTKTDDKARNQFAASADFRDAVEAQMANQGRTKWYRLDGAAIDAQVAATQEQYHRLVKDGQMNPQDALRVAVATTANQTSVVGDTVIPTNFGRAPNGQQYTGLHQLSADIDAGLAKLNPNYKGKTPETIDELQTTIQKKYPNATIVGVTPANADKFGNQSLLVQVKDGDIVRPMQFGTVLGMYLEGVAADAQQKELYRQRALKKDKPYSYTTQPQ